MNTTTPVMNAKQTKAVVALIKRLQDENWELDMTTIKTTSDDWLSIKAVPTWKRGWGSGSFIWYFINPEGLVRS